MKCTLAILSASIVSWCAAPTVTLAAIKPHPLFADGAVLQQDKPVPVWGTTDRNEPVKVRFAGQEVSATPADGKWRVDLAPLRSSSNSQAMTITQGSDSVELKNILVGEVWICGGQSNMVWPLSKAEEGKRAVAASANDSIRLLSVAKQESDSPLAEPKIARSWTACNPRSVANFSAVAYYFARDLERSLHRPIGLINTSVGSTFAEQWMSAESLDRDDLKNMPAPKGKSGFYNGMIAPLAPFAVQGVIWYQGEEDTEVLFNYYKTAFPLLIKNWRSTLSQGEIPFLFVQIAPFEVLNPKSPPSNYPAVRDAQLIASKISPRTAMVVTTDVGDKKDIHPRQKEPIGARLALAARAVAYGEKIPYSGPVFDGMKIEDDKAIISFQHVGGGLEAKDGEFTGFTLAGPDKQFHDAVAKIEGDTVVVTCDKVKTPVAVRYGWRRFPVVNLWNKDGFPASPFRTDDYELSPEP